MVIGRDVSSMPPKWLSPIFDHTQLPHTHVSRKTMVMRADQLRSLRQIRILAFGSESKAETRT